MLVYMPAIQAPNSRLLNDFKALHHKRPRKFGLIHEDGCATWNALAAEPDRQCSLCAYRWITKVSPWTRWLGKLLSVTFRENAVHGRGLPDPLLTSFKRYCVPR